MELDERKMKILKCIIRTYLETGEPVGSRTISKDADLNVSSATIRNEMSDLEEMGLIVQPHTSAGRVPTDRGYRLYVDQMMEEKDREIGELKDLINGKMDRVESFLKQMAKVLAQSTNYATMISGPRLSENALKLIQLSRLDSRHLVCVLVIEGNVIKNTVIEIESAISEQELMELNVILNSALQGKTLDDITLAMIDRLQKEAGDYSMIVASVLETLSQALSENQKERPEVYTSGAMNIFKYPELSDSSKASSILSTFEEKEQILNLISERKSSGGPIQIYIGSESSIDSMRDCSVVTASYELGGGLRGNIGIVGPRRMDYDHVVGTLKTLMDELDQIYHSNNE